MSLNLRFGPGLHVRANFARQFARGPTNEDNLKLPAWTVRLAGRGNYFSALPASPEHSKLSININDVLHSRLRFGESILR